MPELTEQQWADAKAHLDEVISIYETIPTGVLALRMFMYPARARYDRGDRDLALYDEMRGFE